MLKNLEAVVSFFDKFFLISFLKLVKTFFMKTHPEKRSVSVKKTPFMTEAYSKAILQRTCFRNKFLKNPTDLNKVLHNKQKNYCASLLRKKKRIPCKIK